MAEQLPNLQTILDSSQENLPALSASLNLCLDTEFQLAPGSPVAWNPDDPPESLTGTPGVCVVFKPSDLGGYLITIPESMPIPDWYREPDESQQSKLQTLAMEWTYGMLPEGFQEGEYSTLISNDLITAIRWSGTNESTEMVEIQLVNEEGKPNKKSSLWLIGPLETPPLGNEEENLDEEIVEQEEPAQEIPNETISEQPIPSQQADMPANTEQNETEQNSTEQNDVASVVGRVRRLMPMLVEVSVSLAEKKIDLAQLQNLSPGTLITFSKSCDDLLDLYVNNQLYGQGEAVKIGEKFGLKVNEVGTIRERPPGVFTL